MNRDNSDFPWWMPLYIIISIPFAWLKLWLESLNKKEP